MLVKYAKRSCKIGGRLFVIDKKSTDTLRHWITVFIVLHTITIGGIMQSILGTNLLKVLKYQ